MNKVLPPLPGAREDEATEFQVVSPQMGIGDDAKAMTMGLIEYIDLIVLGPNKVRVNVRYKPGPHYTEVLLWDPGRRTVLHIYDGECYQIDLNGNQIGRPYGCTGTLYTQPTDHDVPLGTIMVEPKEGDDD